MCVLFWTIWCAFFLNICLSWDISDSKFASNKPNVINERKGLKRTSPYAIRRLKRQAYNRRDDRRQGGRGNHIERPTIRGHIGKNQDDGEDSFDFPFLPDFNSQGGGDGQSVFATPDGFPINPEDFGLDWETILNEPSITEIHENLTSLEKSVVTVKDEQYEIRRSLNRVLEEMGTLKADMDIFQKVMNDSLTSVMKALVKYDRSLKEGKRTSEKLQRRVSIIAEMPVNKEQILYMRNVSDTTKDYTKKHIKKVRKKMNSLEENLSKLRLSWGNRIRDVSSMVKEVRGAGKDHTAAIAYLSSNVSSLRNGVNVIERASSGISHTRACDSGSLTFMNYPFNSNNWPQTRKVRFNRKFPYTPSVGYGVTAMDTSYRYNTRLRIQVQRVTPSGFILYCSGWHNSRLYQVDVAWMAC
ncbi:uncharacterized protein LOC126809862 [Patella vulgata]|uniref:uncharacterized protein LOC126809862 n=1 Tax=Patella vulgata TaxID=6465 RepID=UPI002180996B|nr:uncharacterized protein LOC126809862 [Patella vulgata]